MIYLVDEKCSDDTICVCLNFDRGTFSEPKNQIGIARLLTRLMQGENSHDPPVHGMCSAGTSASSVAWKICGGQHHWRKSISAIIDRIKGKMFEDADLVQKYLAKIQDETKKHAKSDQWRKFQLWRCSANPESLFAQRMETNLIAQTDDIIEMLKQFHKKLFSMDILTVAVVSKQELDESTKQFIQGQIECIPDVGLSNEPGYEFSEKPFPDTHLRKLVKTISSQKTSKNTLTIKFMLPCTEQYILLRPLHYIASIMACDGQHSLSHHLKSQGLISSLLANTYRGLFSSVEINLELTDEGVKLWRDVAGVVFEFVGLLRKEGATSWYYDELRRSSVATYKYGPSFDSPLNLAVTAAENLGLYGKERIKQLKYSYADFDKNAIDSVIEQIDIKNCCIMLMIKENKGDLDRVDPVFGTLYSISDLGPDLLSTLSSLSNPSPSQTPPPPPSSPTSKLHLPPPNYTVPSDFTMNTQVYSHPHISHTATGMTIVTTNAAHTHTPRCLLVVHMMYDVFDGRRHAGVVDVPPSAFVQASAIVTEFGYLVRVEGFRDNLVRALGGLVGMIGDGVGPETTEMPEHPSNSDALRWFLRGFEPSLKSYMPKLVHFDCLVDGEFIDLEELKNVFKNHLYGSGVDRYLLRSQRCTEVPKNTLVLLPSTDERYLIVYFQIEMGKEQLENLPSWRTAVHSLSLNLSTTIAENKQKFDDLMCKIHASVVLYGGTAGIEVVIHFKEQSDISIIGSSTASILDTILKSLINFTPSPTIHPLSPDIISDWYCSHMAERDIQTIIGHQKTMNTCLDDLPNRVVIISDNKIVDDENIKKMFSGLVVKKWSNPVQARNSLSLLPDLTLSFE